MSVERQPPAMDSPPSLWSGRPGAARRGWRRVGTVLRLLAAAKRQRHLYPVGHPAMAEITSQLTDVLTDLLLAQPVVRFHIYEDTFFWENRLLLEESFLLYPLLMELKQIDIGGFEFHRGIEGSEIERFVDVLHTHPRALREMGGVAGALKEKGVASITALPRRNVLLEKPRAEIDVAEVYRVALRSAYEFDYAASEGLPLDLRKARLFINAMVDVVVQDRFAFLGFNSLKRYDEDTSHHCVNVCVLSVLMGTRLSLDRPQIFALGIAALLHDLGKVRVPWQVITKPGVLTPRERDLINRHPIYGAHLLQKLPGLARIAMVVAFEHHAHYDLTGYPQIAAKDRPHLFSRIVQIADFYEAVTSSRRVYRRPMLPDMAMKMILSRAGQMFDPTLARLFVRLLGLYPAGSVVVLDTGELAVVVRTREEDVFRPQVKVIRGPSGEDVDPFIVNAAEDTRQVVQCVDPLEARVNVLAYV
ncbi:MAG: HD-GYP domain-containing protein [Armatimonadetes bacterium]|nr:HD-GYP domain-containing protein [Armatimonadota bacterium]